MQKSSQPNVPEDFARFWNAYPKHVAKLAALKAWKSMKPTEALVEEILAALEWQVRQPQWIEGRKDHYRFCPNPASWINAGRWMDEPPQSVMRQQSSVDYLAECPHSSRCTGTNACRVLRDIAAMKAEG